MIKAIVLVGLVACVLSQQAPPPPFLQNAPAAKQREFQQLIESSGGLTDNQVEAKVKSWIGQQSSSIQSAFNSFQSQAAAQKAQGEAAHKAAIARFSPAAKAADAKLVAISNNPNLSQQQKGQQIDALFQSLPQNVVQEIQNAMQG